MNLSSPPVFPDRPPEPFRETLGKHPVRYWRRIALAVWLLATTGYALQVEIAEGLAELLGIRDAQSGSIKRLLKQTMAEEHHLVLRSDPIRLVYQEQDVLLRLSEKGEQLARLLGCQPVPSEWQTFLEKHNGEKQKRHMVASLKFAYYFRKRGCAVQVLPHINGRLRPDLLARTSAGAEFYLEVETEPRSRPEKWYAIQKRFGLVRLCLLTEAAQESMVQKLEALDPPVDYTITTLSFLANDHHPQYFFAIGS